MQQGEIAIVINDATAVYPLAIDPLVAVEQAKLIAGDGGPSDYFGTSVAISGDTAIVGTKFADVGGNADQGAAYVFVRNGISWTQQAKLTADDGVAYDQFGFAVAIAGDTALVGASYDTVAANLSQGSAYVFVRSGTTWTQQAKLMAVDGGTGDFFGYSVSLSGDTALVGAYRDNVGAYHQGSAYVFVRSGTAWTPQQKLLADDGSQDDAFGNSVSLSGDTAVIGASVDDIGANFDQGSAYVFVRSGTTWSQQQKLVVSDGMTDDRFGTSVAISGDTVLVGEPFRDVGVDSAQGAAYVFVRNGTTWTQQAQLVAKDGQASDNFGNAVAIFGDMAVVGAYADNGMASVDQGSAYFFVRNGATWTEESKLVASDGTGYDAFGRSVSLSGNSMLIGADTNDVNANFDQGSAYVFALSQANGDTCIMAAECASNFCVDGVCCDSACGDGNLTDCQACSVASGAVKDGTCSPCVIGTECRAAVNECDVAEACDGSTPVCPTDTPKADGTICAGGVCKAGTCIMPGGTGGNGGAAGSGGSGGSGGAAGSGGSAGSDGSGGGSGLGGNGGSVGEGGMGGAAGDGKPSGGENKGCNCNMTETFPLNSTPFALLALGWLARKRRICRANTRIVGL